MARQPRRPAQRPRRGSVRQEPRGPAWAFELEDVEALRQSLQATIEATRRRLPSAEQLQDAIRRALPPDPGAMGAWRLAIESLQPVTSMPEAEPPPIVVDDEWTTIALGLSANEPDVLVLLDAYSAHSRKGHCKKSELAEELSLSHFQVDRAVRSLRRKGLLDSAPGRGDGGVWITISGRNVAARVPSNCLKTFRLYNTKKGAQTLRRAQ